METKWKLISVLFSGPALFWTLFLIKGSMALDTSDATTEQIKKKEEKSIQKTNEKSI